jgi:hypothetical protein
MIVLPVVQGFPEWVAARLGIPTASRFDSIMTTKTRKLSSASTGYMGELLAERLFGHPVKVPESGFMLRGSEMEKSAVAAYEFERGVDVQEVGLCLRDDRRAGASPDRLVGDDGGLEIKCLAAHNHVLALLGLLDDDYLPQCQGQMWVTGRAWVDLMFYNPDLPHRIVRIKRDGDYISDLDAAVAAFCQRLDEAQKALRTLYNLNEVRSAATAEAIASGTQTSGDPAQPAPAMMKAVTQAIEALPVEDGLESLLGTASTNDDVPDFGPLEPNPRDEFFAAGERTGWKLSGKGSGHAKASFVATMARTARIILEPGAKLSTITADQWKALLAAALAYEGSIKGKATAMQRALELGDRPGAEPNGPKESAAPPAVAPSGEPPRNQPGMLLACLELCEMAERLSAARGMPRRFVSTLDGVQWLIDDATLELCGFARGSGIKLPSQTMAVLTMVERALRTEVQNLSGRAAVAS